MLCVVCLKRLVDLLEVTQRFGILRPIVYPVIRYDTYSSEDSDDDNNNEELDDGRTGLFLTCPLNHCHDYTTSVGW